MFPRRSRQLPAEKAADRPWTRKHDDPRRALIQHAPCIVYPTSLRELIDICKDPSAGERLKAAGSHWALSAAAISDHTFLETHDPRPNSAHQAMGRTLTNVIPNCLTREYLQHMVDAGSDLKWYLVHIESGKRIYQLYAELDARIDVNDPRTLAGVIKRDFGDAGYGGPWAFNTLGGAGGQTVVGALSTGTHGGDFDRPPLADSVVALHLVADGGKHYWIEPVDLGVPQLTDDVKLSGELRTDELGDLGEFEIIRDSDVFNAALVSVGRFGAIYSVVLKAVPQYALHEKRRIHLWRDIKDQIKDSESPLYKDQAPGGTIGPQRFLQIAVCLTSIMSFQGNLVGITKRWDVPMSSGIPGKAERVGDVIGFDEQGLKFSKAGNSHPFSPDDDDPSRGGSPSFLEKACGDGSFVKGALTQAVGDLTEFINSGGKVVSTAIAAVAAVGSGGILLLLAALAVIVELLREIIDGFDDDVRLGEVMESVKNELLDPNETDPVKRGAGVFAWQLIAYLVFQELQSERDYSAVSYAVMDEHNYLDRSCNLNVDSVEVFFDASDDRLIAFIDELIAFETAQEVLQGKAFLGYASLRFTQPTRALIGMQWWKNSCSVEVACLKDLSGSQELVDFAVRWARNPNSGAVLHWGQRNDANRREVERFFGERLVRWRRGLARITDDGRHDRFSNEFTRSMGLEVV